MKLFFKKTVFHSCHRDSDINAVIFGLNIITCAPKIAFCMSPCKTQSHNSFTFCAVGPYMGHGTMCYPSTPKSNRQALQTAWFALVMTLKRDTSRYTNLVFCINCLRYFSFAHLQSKIVFLGDPVSYVMAPARKIHSD